MGESASVLACSVMSHRIHVFMVILGQVILGGKANKGRGAPRNRRAFASYDQKIFRSQKFSTVMAWFKASPMITAAAASTTMAKAVRGILIRSAGWGKCPVMTREGIQAWAITKVTAPVDRKSVV